MNWRIWHRWVSVITALPFAIVLVTGLLLASRGFFPWMQPVYPSTSGGGLKVGFSQILEATRSVPEAGIASWEDVAQIDVRPRTGQIRVRAKRDHWEVQIDGSTGAVLGAGKRRVAWFTSLHEGAFFGDTVRYAIFFPSALGALFLLLSGLVLFLAPHLRRRPASPAGSRKDCL